MSVPTKDRKSIYDITEWQYFVITTMAVADIL